MNSGNLLGETLRRLRKAKGLTVRELDRRSGISGRHIENIEAGRATNVKVNTLRALAGEVGPELLVAAFSDVATLSVRGRSRRTTASKLGWPGWPMAEETPALALAGR